MNKKISLREFVASSITTGAIIAVASHNGVRAEQSPAPPRGTGAIRGEVHLPAGARGNFQEIPPVLGVRLRPANR